MIKELKLPKNTIEILEQDTIIVHQEEEEWQPAMYHTTVCKGCGYCKVRPDFIIEIDLSL